MIKNNHGVRAVQAVRTCFLCKVQKNNEKIWQLIRQVVLAKGRKVCYTAINK